MACSLTSFKFLFKCHFTSEALPGHPTDGNGNSILPYFCPDGACPLPFFIWLFVVSKFHQGRDLEFPSHQQYLLYISAVLNKYLLKCIKRGGPLRWRKGCIGEWHLGWSARKCDFYGEGKGFQVEGRTRAKAKRQKTAG